MGSISVAQIGLIVSVMSIAFTLATLAVLIFAIVKTGGAVRVLVVVAGVLMLLARASFPAVTALASDSADRVLIVLVPQIVASVLGLASTVCLVLAVVKAWGGRQGAQSTHPPGPPGAYLQQTQQPPR
ncbi:hypothetical protein [Enemella evansiae]|uniref:hypothetical protein n=1 Tax=Enemella evansiae TaxID=2016499 RepID=UPI00105C2907|nr:hypothetical protein [Enemella evansiae]TDO91353.1 hypothetical protein C8D81_1652 [Enemella evansiae]